MHLGRYLTRRDGDPSVRFPGVRGALTESRAVEDEEELEVDDDDDSIEATDATPTMADATP